jgi:hypothetical protein
MRPSCVASCSLLRLDPPPDTKIANALLALSGSSPAFALVAATLFAVAEVDRRCGDDSELTAGNRASRPPVLARTSQRTPSARLRDPPTTRARGRLPELPNCARSVHCFTHAQAPP